MAKPPPLISHQIPHTSRLHGAISILTMLASMSLGPLVPPLILLLYALSLAQLASTLLAFFALLHCLAGHSPRWCRFYLRSAGWFTKGVHIHFEPSTIDAVAASPSMWCMHPHGTSVGFGFSLNGAVRLRAEAEALYLPPAFVGKVPVARLRRCNGVQAPMMFNVPLLRNALLGFGCATPATREGMRGLFEGGVDFGILPGGMEEVALYTKGRERVYLRRRAGFIKYGLQHGYLVVPGYTFGECDCYTSLQAGKGLRMWMLKHVGLIVPVFWGPKWWCPALPDPDVQLNTVVGQAFRLPVIKEPTKEDVDKWHKKYIESLVELFDTHKERFGYGDRELEIV